MPATVSDLAVLVDLLYREHYGKLVSTLLRQFGKDFLEPAEDVVQEAFMQALRTWPETGVPATPAAWLYTVARNGAIGKLRQERKYIPDNGWLTSEELARHLQSGEQPAYEPDEVNSNLLRALFLCTNNDLSPKAQIALILKTLAGFTVPEIADALHLSEAAVAKLLVRARQKLRERKESFLDYYVLASPERTQTVLQSIYLMFNLGYFDPKTDTLIRKDLCWEALSLARLMAKSSLVLKPECSALLALLLFHTARLEARFNTDNQLVSLAEQDRQRWNRPMIAVGAAYLHKCLGTVEPGRYVIEAAIAYLHTTSDTYATTPWATILELYRQLEQTGYYPNARLAKAYVQAELGHYAEALKTLDTATTGQPDLTLLTKAKLLQRMNQLAQSQRHYQEYLTTATSPLLRDFVKRQLKPEGESGENMFKAY